ncbi:MAG: sigma 54-interacting transcriptional regulator [Deltaproteobacteria bacterium]
MPILTIRDGACSALREVHTEEPLDDAVGGTERLPIRAHTRVALLLPGGRRFVLGSRGITLGKSARCDLVLPDGTVSALHCRVVPVRAEWVVRDAGSTNGTFVGGLRVESAVLSPGSVLTLGRTRIMVVSDPEGRGDDADGDSRAGTEGALVGDSAGMVAVRHAIRRYAPQPFPVLVQGETGSGKELVARMLHEQSSRPRGPFVAINAGAIAPDLVESELFGHERGAFTGALTRRRGVFEEASGGTLFLDELGELPLAQQAKLLRVLETREVRRIGGEGTLKVDFRIVCATHRDLPARVAEGRFRADLLYRLDLLRVRLPSLRERASDIPVLARHLLARVANETGRVRRLDDAAMLSLIEHPWPGNVRELYGVLCRAAAEAETERVGIEHLDMGDGRASLEAAPLRDDPSAVATPGQSGFAPAAEAPRELDSERLLALYDACGGNVSRIARVTGLARSTIRERLKRFP